MSNASLVAKKYFHLDDEQKLNWLRLIRSQNVGPVTFRQLIMHYGTAEAAIDALPDLARRGGAAARIKIFPREDAEREIALCEHFGAKIVALGEPDFPPLLRANEESPPLLCVKGSTDILLRKMVAIVGSRNASISGMKFTQRFAAELGENDYVTVSGLARGIDTAAHKASVQTGTVAVFAGGVDYIYPRENLELAHTIVENDGAIISEMPMGWKPRAKDFPRRNRIVTGLANGVVVVEAAKRSGSLISARLANEMGRVVLAVPGSPLDPRSEGTNGLIRKGATLVTSTQDILEALLPIDDVSIENALSAGTSDIFLSDSTPPEEPDDALRNQIKSALTTTPTDIDDIISYTNASPAQVQLVLVELSLAGRLERHSGNRVSILR